MNEWSEEARKAYAEYHRQWRAKNPDKVRAINARYYAKKHQQNEKQPQNEMKKRPYCKYCTLENDWQVPKMGSENGLSVAFGIEKKTAGVSICYKKNELDYFQFPIKYCPYCGKKLEERT